ncbi:hypothetical protein FRC09_005296 [Ceratobasidium sp. 395]|nr:hypothetical protein FRC09_005296 [Ceratobasidium sp. 395]
MSNSLKDETRGSSVIKDFGSGGDTILRSLDGIDFRVHSVVLSLASPVLADMFRLGTQQTTVNVAEASDMLDFLLKFIYPGPPPPVSFFEVLEKGLHLADKYQLEGMKLHLRERLSLKSSPVSAYSNPLRALAFACAHGLTEEASLAASIAFESYDFRKVNDLAKLCKEMPSIGPIVKMIGIPSARVTILNSVLFQFHQRPMALVADSKNFLCTTCQDQYLNRSRYAAPEWQARWAHWVFKELETRPIAQCDDVFTVEFLKLAMCKGTVPLSSNICGCHTKIYSHKYYFEKWTAEVRECLVNRLKTLDPLDGIS